MAIAPDLAEKLRAEVLELYGRLVAQEIFDTQRARDMAVSAPKYWPGMPEDERERAEALDQAAQDLTFWEDHPTVSELREHLKRVGLI